MERFSCAVCQSHDGPRPLPAFAGLPRVTSDCKPWPTGGELAVCEACGMIQKPPTVRWKEEIGRIYGDYEIYHLSQGAEQVIFAADGSAAPRSQSLVAHVVERSSLPADGRLIDIGCGNGAALASFGRALPGWRLCGHELSDRALPSLRRIPGFEALYAGPVADIPGRFDLVSAIHSLEHMSDPGALLAEAAGLLTDGGTLFIEVPDIETSPFDLLVADHRSHFSRATLGHLAERAGIAVDELDNRVLAKEITLLGRRGAACGIGGTARAVDPAEGIHIAERTLAWLEGVLEEATKAAAATSFGIFGSSVSGIWLYGALRDRVAFFVDEDATRIGRRFDGKPILAPDQVPAGSTVFIPLVPDTAARVAGRLAGIPARFVLPPVLPA